MISLIVAYAKNRTIGYQGRIPWNIKGELAAYLVYQISNISIIRSGRKNELFRYSQKNCKRHFQVQSGCMQTGQIGMCPESVLR